MCPSWYPYPLATKVVAARDSSKRMTRSVPSSLGDGCCRYSHWLGFLEDINTFHTELGGKEIQLVKRLIYL